jgi:hypothetical protein
VGEGRGAQNSTYLHLESPTVGWVVGGRRGCGSARSSELYVSTSGVSNRGMGGWRTVKVWKCQELRTLRINIWSLQPWDGWLADGEGVEVQGSSELYVSTSVHLESPTVGWVVGGP